MPHGGTPLQACCEEQPSFRPSGEGTREGASLGARASLTDPGQDDKPGQPAASSTPPTGSHKARSGWVGKWLSRERREKELETTT